MQKWVGFLLVSVAAVFGLQSLAGQAVGSVLINEICFDSDAAGGDIEFVELYNPGVSAVDLSGWAIGDDAGLFVFSAGASIAAGDYLVLLTRLPGGENFQSYFGIDYDIDATTGVLQLGNSGDVVVLWDDSVTPVIIDYVVYAGGGTGGGGSGNWTYPAYTGTTAPDTAGTTQDASIGRIPNGVNADGTPGDAATEQAGTSFKVAPWTPGRPNEGPILIPYEPGSSQAVALDRDPVDPTRHEVTLAGGFNLTGSTEIVFEVRYYDSAVTLNVTLSFNAGESQGFTSLGQTGLTLPGPQTTSTSFGFASWLASPGISGQLPMQGGVIVIDVDATDGGSVNLSDKIVITVAVPEMDVARGGAIADGGTDTVTGAATGVASTLSYTISNSGTATLNITTPVTTSGLNNCTINVTTQPGATVAAGGNTALVIDVTPTAAGAFSFDLSIASDDSNENPYDFTVSGTAGGAAAPEIDIQRGTSIADGGTDNLGSRTAGTTLTLTYTIQNQGAAVLTLTTPVAISGATNCTVNVTSQPGTTVAISGATTAMVIQVTPTANGAFSFAISVANDDSDENPYNITVSGQAGSPGATSGGGGGGGGGGCVAGFSRGDAWAAMALLLAIFALGGRVRWRKSV